MVFARGTVSVVNFLFFVDARCAGSSYGVPFFTFEVDIIAGLGGLVQEGSSGAGADTAVEVEAGGALDALG